MIRQQGKSAITKQLVEKEMEKLAPGERILVLRSKRRGGNVTITRNNNQIEEKSKKDT